jgi:hypothetical protein
MRATITPTAPPDMSTVRTRLADQLGPFQKLWEAWDEADVEIRNQPLEHFELVIGHQLVEFKQHRDEGNNTAAAQEAVDIISAALNLMRWMELKPNEIADIAQSRAEDRMRGKTFEILKKYETAETIKNHQK